MDHVLTPTMENYMEIIFLLLKYNDAARVTDIANKMDVTMSTVTSALKRLRARKMIEYSTYGTVSLTSRGYEIAKKIYRRHEVLSEFFGDVLSLSIGCCYGKRL